jgi:hypothetical protein
MSFSKTSKNHEPEERVLLEVFEKLSRISQKTMLLLINYLHKNVRDKCSYNLGL